MRKLKCRVIEGVILSKDLEPISHRFRFQTTSVTSLFT